MRSLTIPLLLLVGGLLGPARAHAQVTGAVYGQVSNENNEPLDGATITVTSLARTDEHYELTTDPDGQFAQSDLQPGQYSVSAERDGLGSQIFRILIHPAGSVDVRFVLEAGRTAAPWLRALRDDEATVSAFSAGVRASRGGDHVSAIEEFEAALRLTPTCVDCYFNIGVAYSRLNRFVAAEAAYRQALRIQSNFAAAYYGLADTLNRQGRTEEAAAARGEANRIAIDSLAAGRTRARESVQRGIGFWNSGDTENAMRQFQEALEADSTLVEAYYWLGLAYASNGDTDGATRSLTRYLGSAPAGEHADEARRLLAPPER